uniref:Uncharacterized protein n=1 Tax=Triticum urartu TaxID=4572 RepID=A0A8R7PCC4_TRIUA
MRAMLQEDEEGPLQDPRQDEHQDHLLRREEQLRDGVRAVRPRQAVPEALLRGRPGDQGDACQWQGAEGGQGRRRRRRREAEGAQGRRQGREGWWEGGEAQGRRREGRQGEAQGRRGRQAGEEGQVRRRAAGHGREARQGHAAAAARHEHGRPRPAPGEDEAGQAAGRGRAPATADDGAARGRAGGGRAVHLAGAGRAHVLQLRPDAVRPAVVLRRGLRRWVRRGVPVLQAARAGRRVLRRAGARPPGVVPRQPAAVLPAAAAAAAAVLRRGPQRRVQRHVIGRRRAMDRGRAIRHRASVISCVVTLPYSLMACG